MATPHQTRVVKFNFNHFSDQPIRKSHLKVHVTELRSIDTNARNGSAPNLLNWNKFIAKNYEYLVAPVVIKKATVVQNLQWQKFATNTKISHSFKLKNYNIKCDFIPYGLALEFEG